MRKNILQCIALSSTLGALAAFAPRVPCRSHAGEGRAAVSSVRPLAAVNAVEDAVHVAQSDGAELAVASRIRPLHRNWWPVGIETALDADRPNAVELLGEQLVLYRDGAEWKCLADRCSHRFAPLSEGRIVRSDGDSGAGGGCASCTIQCAYHGWEFDGDGRVTRVPQYDHEIDERRASSVASYPVRLEAGMVWVWSDPDESSWVLADSVLLPISPLVRASYDQFGADACFMRDLPYGMELLGENLLDLSHLPFSHHSVGGLSREMGCEMPLRVMAEQQRVEYAEWEKEFDGHEGYHAVPLHQVEVLNATQSDPMFLSMGTRNIPVSPDANTTISFFEPCHVRYRRERIQGTYGHVELFMSPTRAGGSRVFLWNTYHTPTIAPSAKKPGLKARLKSLSPLAAAKKALIAKLMNPATARAHGMMHAIFDGDGIFLHKQGFRMQRTGRTFREYSTPSSADVLLNSYRRYLDAAAKLSVEASGSDIAAKAVSYPVATAYRDDLARSDMLDRYESHTKHCVVCSAELKRCEKKLKVYELARTSAVGASGASAVALVMSLASSAIAPPMVRFAAVSTTMSILTSIGLSQKKKATEKKIQNHLFLDYVHAEKD